MVAPNLVIGVARKLQCSGSDLAQVLAQISTELGLPNEIAVALAVPDGEQPTPITNLGQLPAKAKVQVWPAKDFATPLVTLRATPYTLFGSLMSKISY